MKRSIAWWLRVLALAGALGAHDLYLMPEHFEAAAGAPLRVVFQNGDEFPVASAAVRPDRLRNTRLVWRGGRVEFTGITAEATRTTATVQVPANGGTAILTANTVPNFIALDADKFRAYLEHENLTGAIRWRESHGEAGKPGRERYSKYVKSLIVTGKPDGFYREKTGLTIEIVPEADPNLVRAGGTLPVQVLFRGRPAVDVAVESAWLEKGRAQMETFGRTDGEGRIRIPVKAAGPHRLHAIVMERCAEPNVADWESFWASLTFSVPEK